MHFDTAFNQSRKLKKLEYVRKIHHYFIAVYCLHQPLSRIDCLWCNHMSCNIISALWAICFMHCYTEVAKTLRKFSTYGTGTCTHVPVFYATGSSAARIVQSSSIHPLCKSVPQCSVLQCPPLRIRP